MNVLNQLISERLINAIGWTILHSIWQGAAVALGFVLLMFLLRRCSPHTRYLVGVMALLLVVGISLTTFFNIYHPVSGVYSAISPEGSSTALLSQAGHGVNLHRNGIFSTFRGYFNRHLPLIVTLWFVGVLIFLLRLAGGFLYNQRIKAFNTRPLNKSWQSFMQKLCRRAVIKKPVQLLASALIKVPMTIGHLKPVILIPVGMVTGLPRSQLEALLAHELAHILRKDYLVNIMQHLIDILYFYHPGVRWISSYLRAEREHCCDDMAISFSGDSLNFARALSNIDGAGKEKAGLALSASGKQALLFSRVKRLFTPRKKGPDFTEGFIGACILVFFILIMVVGANAAAGLNRDVAGSKVSSLSQTANKNDDKDKVQKEEERMKKKQEEIAKEEQKTRRKVEKLLQEEHERIAALKEKLEKMEKEKKIELEKLLQREQELKKKEKQLQLGDRETLKKMELELLEKEKVLARRAEALRKMEYEKQLEMEEKSAQQQIEFNEQKEYAKKLEMEEKLAREQSEFNKQEEYEKQLQMEKKLAQQQSELNEQKMFIDNLKKELKKDKLIDNEEDFEFKLTPKGLWINGKKQSQTFYEKYRDIYESSTGKKLKDIKNFRIVNRE